MLNGAWRCSYGGRDTEMCDVLIASWWMICDELWILLVHSMEPLRMSDSMRILTNDSVLSFAVGIPDPTLRLT